MSSSYITVQKIGPEGAFAPARSEKRRAIWPKFMILKRITVLVVDGPRLAISLHDHCGG
jgi:hypothetical protein